MQSENFNLDDLFRQKEAEAKTNLRLREEGRQRLFDRMHTSPMQKTSGRSFTIFYQAAAILILVMVSLYFASEYRQDNKQELKPALVKATDNLQQKQNAKINTTVSPTSLQPVIPEQPAIVTKKKNQHTVINTLPETDPENFVANVKQEVKLISPEQEPLPAPQMVLNRFFASLKKPAQVFVIEGSQDHEIKGEEGTRIFIPAYTFADDHGRQVTGKIRFSLTECYELDQITAHKLTTLSNGNLLETGGMLHFDATANDRKLVVADGAALNVSMPAKKFHPMMQLFYGDEAVDLSTGKDFALSPGPDNWTPAGQKQVEWTTKRKNVRVVNYVDNPATVKDVKGKLVANYIISSSCELSVETVKDELLKRYGRRYDEINVTRESKFRKQISTNPFQASVYVGDSVTMPMTMAMRLRLITIEDSARLEKEWMQELERMEIKQKNDDAIFKMKETYNFRITKMGWMNCDRFLNLPKNEVIEYTFKPQMQFDNNVCYSTIIYHKTRSIVEGSYTDGKVSFQRLPKNGPVTVVCIGVKNGVTYLAMKETKVNNNEPELEFKETTPAEFKAQMAKFVLN